MKVLVDFGRCEGHGLCAETAPDLFRLDDDGDLVVLFDGDDVPSGQHETAVRAVRTCPVSALIVERAR